LAHRCRRGAVTSSEPAKAARGAAAKALNDRALSEAESEASKKAERDRRYANRKAGKK